MNKLADNPQTLILYDGSCGLCDRFVRFLLLRDRTGQFRFAALQSEFAKKLLQQHGMNPAGLDTVCVVSQFGLPTEYVMTKSTAALHAVGRLGGVWRLAAAFGIVPPGLRDFLYGVVARHRYRIFGRRDFCPLPSESDRSQFLA